MFHIDPMRFTPEHLTYKALCAVSEIVEQCRAAPVKPSMALRFALAFLYVQSGKRHKWIYDQFWRCIQEEHPLATCAEQAGYYRSRDAQGCLNAMVEHNKMPMTPQFFQRLRLSHSRRRDDSKA
jgi:hypothetical protein